MIDPQIEQQSLEPNSNHITTKTTSPNIEFSLMVVVNMVSTQKSMLSLRMLDMRLKSHLPIPPVPSALQNVLIGPIVACVCTILFATGHELKYWPFSLRHYVLIYKCLPHSGYGDSAYTICTGKSLNILLFCVFGCCLHALPTADRDVELDVHARSENPLGYHNSLGSAL